MFNGAIVIWNSGTPVCRLAGAARISAAHADGTADTEAVVNGASEVLDAYLPGNTSTYRDETGPVAGYVYAWLAAPQFDAAPTCTQSSGPATFTLSIGRLSFTLVNRDDDAVQNKVLRGCQGRILLDGVDQPGA